jgi:hypothetical protein
LEIEGQGMRLNRRAILTGVVAIPLLSCTSATLDETSPETENPIGNPTAASEKDWNQIFANIESELIQQVNKTIESIGVFEKELRQIHIHHLDHLKVFSNSSPTDEAIFNSKPGVGAFGELANLRIKHSRSLNLIKNSLHEISDPLLITTLTQIAGCDNQVIIQLASLMAKVAQTAQPPEVSSG